MRISYWSSDVCFPISTNRPARQMMCARDVPWERQEAWSSRYRSGESTGAIHRPTTPCGHDRSKACCIRQSRKYCASWAAATPRSEEHTSELQSLMRITYAVFCLKQNCLNLHQNKKSAYEIHHTD